MRIIVTGSRNWTDYPVLAAALHEVTYGHHPSGITLVHGACPDGADAYAKHYAEDHGWMVEPHPADWKAHGLGAGYKRNGEMVHLGADVVLGFVSTCTKPVSSRCWQKSGTHASHGTVDCLRKALDAGIPVRTWSDMPRVTR